MCGVLCCDALCCAVVGSVPCVVVCCRASVYADIFDAVLCCVVYYCVLVCVVVF